MHPGNLNAAAGRLQEALEALQLAWQNAQDQWQDENSRHIEETLLRPIANEISKALPAISHMTQVLAQAERELTE